MDANLITTMKQFFFAGVGLLLVSLTGSGCRKASVPQQAPLPVNVVTVVEKEVNEWDEFTGRLEAVESVEIRPRVSGYITEIISGRRDRQERRPALCDRSAPLPGGFRSRRGGGRADAGAAKTCARSNSIAQKSCAPRDTISASEFDQKAATYQGAAAAKRSAEAAKNAAALNLEFTQIKSPIDGRVSDAAHYRRQPGPARSGARERAYHSSLGRSDLCQGRCGRECDPEICEAQRGRKARQRAHGQDPGVDRAWKRNRFPARRRTSISSIIVSIPARARCGRASF